MKFHERGLTLLEVLIAMAIITLVSSGLVFVFHGFVQNAEASALQQHTSITLAQFMDQLESDADSAIAIFVPASDVHGASNADGHEIDFYTLDGAKRPYFWAYTFTASTHSLQKYTYVWNVSSSVTAVGQPIVLSNGSSTVGAFAAQVLSVSSRASSPMFAGYVPVNHTLATGYTGVAAGNNLVQVTATAQADTATGSEVRTTRLLAGTELSGANYLAGTFTPPPNTLSVTVNPIAFASQNAAAQTTTAQENYYVGTFSWSAGTCQNVVTIAQSGSTFTVTPSPTLQTTQSCSFIVSDQLGQAVSVAVTVGFTPNPMTVNPTSILFYSATSASQSIAVSEPYDTGQFTIASSSSCLTGGIAAINATALAGPNATFTVSPSQGGTCSFVVADNHGASQTVSVTVYGPLVVSPTTLNFASSTAPAQTLTATEIAYTQAFSFSSNCTGIATLLTQNPYGPAATGTVTPNAVGSCTYAISDNHGNSQNVGVTVAAPTPAPTPCPGGYSGTPPNCVLASTPAPSPTPTPVNVGVGSGGMTMDYECAEGSGGHCYGWSGEMCSPDNTCMNGPAASVLPGYSFPFGGSGTYSWGNPATWAILDVKTAPTTAANALHLKILSGTLTMKVSNPAPGGSMNACEVYVQPFIFWVDGPQNSINTSYALELYQDIYPYGTFQYAGMTEYEVPLTANYWRIESGTVGATGTFSPGEVDWYSPTLGTGRYAAGLYYWVENDCAPHNGYWGWLLTGVTGQFWQS